MAGDSAMHRFPCFEIFSLVPQERTNGAIRALQTGISSETSEGEPCVSFGGDCAEPEPHLAGFGALKDTFNLFGCQVDRPTGGQSTAAAMVGRCGADPSIGDYVEYLAAECLGPTGGYG